MFYLKSYKIEFIIMVISLIFCINGCKNNPVTPAQGPSSISGIVILNNIMAGTTTPFSGLTMYLINLHFKADTSITADNSAAIVDSAVTDSSGKYTMTNVPAGWYAVVPSVTAGYYQYILANGTSSDSVTITNTRGNYNVSFSAIARATVPGQFTFNTININLPADNTSTLITIYRECLNIFGTGWVYKSFIYPGIQDSKSFDFGYRGSLATTITNNLRCDCSANGQIQFTFYVRQPLTNCPDSTTWQIDWTALTATKIN